jgi:pantoate--beta-alanine ligase
MGNLHEGHLSLLKESLKENDQTILTIFVNPKQFLQGEDLDKYPRTFEQDIEKIKSCIHEDDHVIVFHPTNDHEIYGTSFNTTIKVESMNNVLCAKFRPGHFDGVTTVVYRIFSLCRPTISYFGQKDYQQYQIIKKMRDDLLLETKLKMMPITRDENGLALSSRNRYLDHDQREEAQILPQTLKEIESILKRGKVEDALSKAIEIKSKYSAWQYLEILDSKNLEPLSDTTKEVVIAGAFIVGSTRLIDNRLVLLNHAE